MVVFQDYLEMAMIETLNEYITMFNAATNNCLILRSGSNHGDFVEESFVEAMPDMIKYRDPRTDTALSDVTFAMDKNRHVKVGRTAGPVKYDLTQFNWINKDPSAAGIIIGRNFAEEKFRKYFDLMISILRAAMSNDAADIQTDVSGSGTPNLTYGNMNTAMSKFGDAYRNISTWIMHSKPMFDLWGTNLANTNQLFSYAGVIVNVDPFGNTMIMSDSPSLINVTPTPDEYHCLGLTPGSIIFEENNDFEQDMESIIGRTNLGKRWQSEWSFNAMVKGYRWDSTNGGASPNDAALVLSTNWDNIVNTHKSLPGIDLVVQ